MGLAARGSLRTVFLECDERWLRLLDKEHDDDLVIMSKLFEVLAILPDGDMHHGSAEPGAGMPCNLADLLADCARQLREALRPSMENARPWQCPELVRLRANLVELIDQ